MMLSITHSWAISKQTTRVSTEELMMRYDDEAADWQTTIERLRQPEAYRLLFETIQEQGRLAGFGKKAAVLDCGIGTGALSEAAAAVLPGQTTFHGIDISMGMLLEARKRLETANVSFQLKRQDITKLDYANNSFDVVMSAHMLEHLPNPQDGLDEMLRVLKPDGLLLLVMTRRTLFGSWIRRKWGVHQVDGTRFVGWLGGAGLHEVQLLKVGEWWCANRWLSVGCVGIMQR